MGYGILTPWEYYGILTMKYHGDMTGIFALQRVWREQCGARGIDIPGEPLLELRIEFPNHMIVNSSKVMNCFSIFLLWKVLNKKSWKHFFLQEQFEDVRKQSTH